MTVLKYILCIAYFPVALCGAMLFGIGFAILWPVYKAWGWPNPLD